MNENSQISDLKKCLQELKVGGKVLVAVLYGSYAKGTAHKRSDIDLAVYIKAGEQEKIEIVDKILMSTEIDISILDLADEEESPFVVQEALKGLHLIEPDAETLYAIDYFSTKVDPVDRDMYFADRDTRHILDKTINDLILCTVDIAEECLKKHGRTIPDTYRDTILACHEFVGEIVLQVAPLVKHRNETIHQYLKVNWQNIVTVKSRLPAVKEFVAKARGCLVDEVGG